MANTDELFDGVALAIETQSAYGTTGASVPSLAGSIDSSDGIVLGDRGSGDAESGITLPTMRPFTREKPPVASSWTERYSPYIRTLLDGFSITFAMQGNGATATPAAGEAQPLTGLDAIWQSVGLVGANGIAPAYVYTPRYSTIYLCCKLWHGDHSYVYNDCVVDSMSIAFPPGGTALATANIKIGSIAEMTSGVTFPTCDYTTQSSLAAPIVSQVAFAAFGTTRSFENLTLNITNEIGEFGRSNQTTTGRIYYQNRRRFTVDGTLYIDATDTAAAYDQMVSTSAPTNDLTFTVGTAAGAAATINAFSLAVNNLQPDGIKYNRVGSAFAVELSGARATEETTAGAEFALTFT